jgi:hypothetical protein
MTKPASLVDKVRLHLYGPDTTTSRGLLSADGARAHHDKDPESSALSFTASRLETILAADPTLLDDAFAVPERYVSGSWVAFGTPYMLAPGSGTIYGTGESAAQEQSPRAIGALIGLAAELVLQPTEPDPDSPTYRYAGGVEQNLYVGWMSKGYDETGDDWHDVDLYDPSGQPKANKPPNWPDSLAEWVYRDPSHGDTGGLSLFRFGTFTLATMTRVHFVSSSDENHKIYLDGPNQGGCIIDFTGDEDGYNDEPGYWSRRLAPGTYRVSGEMRTIDSEGGDGNDSIRLSVYKFTDTQRATMAVLLRSDADTRVRRQAASADRPGMSVGETLRRLLVSIETVADGDLNGATILKNNRTFTDTADSSSTTWPDGREWVWPLGTTTFAQVLADMAEDADVDMGPTFAFNAWADRGSDISASVAFVGGDTTPGATMNIEGETYESAPPGPNAYMTQSLQGFDLRIGSLPTGSRRRFGGLEFGTAGSLARARRLADAAIRQNKLTRRFYSYQVVQVSGAVFYTNMNLCDIVNGRDYKRAAEDQELTAMGWAVNGDLATFYAETTGAS